MKCTILSDGAWGTALGMVLCGNGHEVTQYGPFPEYLAQLDQKRENYKFLPGVRLPDAIRFEANIAKATAEAELVVLATPTQYLRSVLEKYQPYYQRDRHLLLNVAKGIENNTWKLIGEVVEEILGPGRFADLSGPSHAEEVSRKVPTLVTVASENPADAMIIRNAFMNDYFRIYTSDDVVGLELGGALKNIMAIAAGIIDGMHLGDNPKAALMTRAVSEMARLGVALGGKAATFSGLSGIGDLIVTCSSRHSRNRHVGEALGRGEKLEDILHQMDMVVAEGVPTTLGGWTLAHRHGVETPIIDQMYEILYHGKDPKTAVRELMTRSAKAED
ncbi:MAG: NAD(P)-dependent glycerol-3-phosphate dehydrogenase [Victivallaceae bacterium]|nr:NAD(P)-dependent glycerol-3-phosphate dehydrogenase [Victivallaceae bacterium]